MEKGFRLQDKREGYKQMLDLTKGYDPTKPLRIEAPIDFLDNNSLIFDPKKNVTDRYTFYSGEPVEEKNYQLVFEINMRENKLLELDIVPSTFPGLIVNKKVLNILRETCPKDFQVFPITIRNKDGKRKSKAFINNDYSLIHIVKKVDSIDFEESEFLLVDDSRPKEPGNVIGPKRLRFKSNCMGGAHIAKDSTLKSIKFISTHLFHVLYKANIRGVEFMPDYLCFYERDNYPELFR